MSRREFDPANYRRISLINWALTPPLLVLFSWPYFYLSESIGVHQGLIYPGALFFSLPFAVTILHGHVTMALGSVHRDYYYEWLHQHPYTFGLFYHPIWIKTRFRLLLVYTALLLLAIGFWVK